MVRCILGLKIFVMIFFVSGILWADQIVLENGDRLTGTLKDVHGGMLTIETEYSDPIRVHVSKIRSVVTDSPVELHLTDGEMLKGTLKTTEEGQIYVESSAHRESTVIDWESVKSINPSGRLWRGNISIGATLQSGNTDRVSASIGAEASRRTERDRFSLRFLFNYAEEDDELTTRDTYGLLKYDFFFRRSLYSFLSVELFSDEFRDLKLRTVIGPGIGYQVWDEDVKSLSVELGIAYFSEDLDEGDDDQWVTARAASTLKWKILGPVIFSDHFVIYPQLDDVGKYQLRNEASLTSPLAYGLGLKLTNIFETDSDPPEGVRKNDIYWLLGLQYTF
jgi:putative salt-induced outer membrane protein YdiY/small nuclear ribonucleoprotein (snRNP)-like protein